MPEYRVRCLRPAGTGTRRCPQDQFEVYWDEVQGEFVLRCAAGHEIRRFFVLVPPDPPPPPDRSPHAAAAQASRQDR